MPTITESTKRKLSLLQLAEELGNVSKACIPPKSVQSTRTASLKSVNN